MWRVNLSIWDYGHTHPLFDKLQEHEIELKRLVIDGEEEKKNKSLVVKAEESDLDSDMALIMMRKRKHKIKEKIKKVPFVPTCYNCGKKGHMKAYCPLFKKANKKFRKLIKEESWWGNLIKF